MRRCLLLTALPLLLTACGDGAEDAVPETVPAPASEADADVSPDDAAPEPLPADLHRVSVGDVLGQFGGEVFGLAMWEHPTTPYLGSVVAANGEAGLTIIPVDREVAPRTADGVFDGGVGVGYLPDGGSLVAASSGDEVIVFVVGDDRTLEEAARLPGGATAVCFDERGVSLIGDEDRYHSAGADGLAATAFAPAVPLPGSVEDCAATTDATLFLTEENGRRVVASAAPEEKEGRGIDAEDITALQGGDEARLVFRTAQGRLMVRTEAGDVAFGLRRDRNADDAPIARLAAGSGNFGGVYRDGVVAVLDDENRLKLLPWSGVARAVGAEVATVSLRPEALPPAPAAITPELPALSLPKGVLPAQD